MLRDVLAIVGVLVVIGHLCAVPVSALAHAVLASPPSDTDADHHGLQDASCEMLRSDAVAWGVDTVEVAVTVDARPSPAARLRVERGPFASPRPARFLLYGALLI